MLLTYRLPAAVLGCALIAATAFAQNRTFTSQYTFGDSLSDNGNAYAASGRTINTGPLNFGGRWSNGPTFAELLGNTMPRRRRFRPRGATSTSRLAAPRRSRR